MFAAAAQRGVGGPGFGDGLGTDPDRGWLSITVYGIDDDGEIKLRRGDRRTARARRGGHRGQRCDRTWDHDRIGFVLRHGALRSAESGHARMPPRDARLPERLDRPHTRIGFYFRRLWLAV